MSEKINVRKFDKNNFFVKNFQVSKETYSTPRDRVVNGPTSSGPNPARTRKYKPEPEN